MFVSSMLSTTPKRCDETDYMLLVQSVHRSQGFDFLFPMFSYFLSIFRSLDLFYSEIRVVLKCLSTSADFVRRHV